MDSDKTWKSKVTDTSVQILDEDGLLIESFLLPKKDKARKALIRNIENEVLDHNYRLQRRDKMRSPEYAKRQSEMRRMVAFALSMRTNGYNK